jgi:hypothetical protein
MDHAKKGLTYLLNLARWDTWVVSIGSAGSAVIPISSRFLKLPFESPRERQ